MTATDPYSMARWIASMLPRVQRVFVTEQRLRTVTDLRSHEPPRISGEGTAVNGPMPLAGGDEAIERA